MTLDEKTPVTSQLHFFPIKRNGHGSRILFHAYDLDQLPLSASKPVVQYRGRDMN